MCSYIIQMTVDDEKFKLVHEFMIFWLEIFSYANNS